MRGAGTGFAGRFAEAAQAGRTHDHHAVSQGQAGFSRPRAGPVGAASRRLVSFQRLLKPLAFPHTKELKVQLNWILSSASGKGETGWIFTRASADVRVIEHLQTQTVTKLSSSRALRTQPRFLFLIYFPTDPPGSSRRNRKRTGGVHGEEGSSTATPRQQPSVVRIRPASLNPCIGLLGSAARAGNTPWKTHSIFPIVVLYIITILFYTHNQASFAVRGGGQGKKKGISRHK